MSNTLVTAWTVAHQIPVSMGFSRQEYWSGSQFTSPGDLLNPGIEPTSPALWAYYVHYGLLFSWWAVSDSATPWTPARQASLSFTISRSLLKFMSIELVKLSKHLILCRTLLFLPSIFPNIRVFSNESALQDTWPKYWNFSFNISPSNEYSGLIPFRIDWFDFLAVKGTVKSLLQHHYSKASILRHSASLWSSCHICTWLLEKL